MTTTTYPKRAARKPVGGFVFLTVQQLCLLWSAYRTRLIQLMDLRVWFAAHEMVARRCQLAPDQVPDYTARELHRLVGGGGGEHLRASLRRLEAIGLLTWSRTTLTFATSPTDLRGVHELSDFHTMYNAIPNNRRRVPVPRQAIRLIAGGLKASVIATMLGHLLRCLYYHEHCCRSGGWCKASWIAEVFRMDLRTIKAARKHLITIDWLRVCPPSQALCNRWGIYALINLSWTLATMVTPTDATPSAASSVSPPPPGFSTTPLPPLSKEGKKPFQELYYQQPTLHADAFIASLPPHPPALPTSRPASGLSQPDKDATKTLPAHAPTLQHIVIEDLHDTARLLNLFTQAQTRGLIGPSDSERLTFCALAEHARAVGSANPCGLFAELVRRQCWHFVTESDEDAAHYRLKAHLYGIANQTRGTPQLRDLLQPELSRDAAIVRHLQTQLARAGFRGDVFGLVIREDASWTRDRWDNAVLELDQARRAWRQANALHRVGDYMDLREGNCDIRQ